MTPHFQGREARKLDLHMQQSKSTCQLDLFAVSRVCLCARTDNGWMVVRHFFEL